MDKRQMHRQACLTFFAHLDFAQAFHHAWEARIAPTQLLPLFPELLLRPLPDSTVLTADLLGRNVHSVLEFVLATRKQHSSDPSAIRPDSELVKTAVNQAESELLEFLWKFHAENQGENRGEDQVENQAENQAENRGESRVVDVALFRLLLNRGDPRLSGFIAGQTSCEEEDVRESLVSRGLYNALASFYVQKKRPRDALQLWRELGEGALREEGVDGVSLTCQFLRNRTETDTLELMRAFLPWVMDRNPDEGYKVVIFGEVSTVPIAGFVLSELERVGASNYRSSYIQYLVVMNHVDDPALTTEFILERIHLLLRQVQEHDLDMAVARVADTPSLVRDQRGQILSFLENNQSYDASQVLAEIDASALFFEKVVVLGRLGRYEESLRIVVYELKSISYACSCCAKFPASSWYLLLRILFAEQDEECAMDREVTRRRRDSFREAALRVLEEHAYEIDPIEVLKIIPEDLTLQQLLQYYQSVVPHSTNVMREARIQRGMEQWR